MDEDAKTEYVLRWLTAEGQLNSLTYQWRMDARERAEELMEEHKAGRQRLLSLTLTTYEYYID